MGAAESPPVSRTASARRCGDPRPPAINPWSAPMASQFLARPFAANRPASFLHISRPEIDLPPGSSPHSDAAYERGAENLARLREGGVLVRDREASFYVYRMVTNGHAQTGVAFAAS